MNEYDLVVIGGGPSGLAAAAYGLHAQLSVAMVTPDLGGKVSYPFALRTLPGRDTVWGASLVHELEMRVRNELEHHYATQAKAMQALGDGRFQVELDGGEILLSDSVIVATGARPQRLYVPGEGEYWGRGVSFSAISHAPFFSKRVVAVVGAGPRAINAVLTLAPLVERIYLIVTSGSELSDSPAAALALNHPKVVAFRGWEVQQVSGDDFVTALDLVGVNGEIRSLEVEGVFVQLGLIPSNSLVRGLADLDSEGHVRINENCETSRPGLFAAGDLTTVHAEQVPVSLGEGAKAALSAWSYLAVNGKV